MWSLSLWPFEALDPPHLTSRRTGPVVPHAGRTASLATPLCFAQLPVSCAGVGEGEAGRRQYVSASAWVDAELPLPRTGALACAPRVTRRASERGQIFASTWKGFS
jgi:hypothetical protein